MIQQLVTDRRRLAPAADEIVRAACLVEQARAAAEAGVHTIHLRELDLDGRALARLASALLDAIRGTATRLVVNDRLDVALAVGAHGVHLRGASMPAQRVRTVVGPGFLVGRSIHSAAEAGAAGPVDYLVAGSVWLTTAKPPGHPCIGLEGLSEIVAAATVSVIAIGGVVPGRAREVAAAGAAGIAAVDAWMAPSPGRSCRATNLHATADAFRAAFAAGNMGSPSRP
jgi:thiamine-phosphate pyrophosphorylase